MSTAPLKIPKNKPDTIELNYIAQGPKQVKFHEAWRTPIRLLSGGFASSKTVTCVFDVLFHLIYNPMFYGATALVVAVTGSHIKTQLLPVFQKIMTNYNDKTNIGLVEGRHYTLSKAPAYMIEFNQGINGGPKIIFASAESETNLRGHSVSIVMVDDLGALTLNEQVWDIIQSRAFREPRFDGDKRGFVLASVNPSSPSQSFVYRRYFHYLQEGKTLPDDLYLDRLELFDNLSMKSQWDTFANQYVHDPIGYQKNILGMWVGAEGLIYSNFNRDSHLIRTKNSLSYDFWDEQGKPYWSDAYLSDPNVIINAGIDFGLNTAVIWTASMKDQDGIPFYIIFDEYFNSSPNATVAKHSLNIRNKGYSTRRYLSDHTLPEIINQYRESGIQCTPADKSGGSILAGIDTIQRLLYTKRIFVHERCVNFLREIEGYVYKKTDVPSDLNNHCMDAARYIIYQLAGKGSSPQLITPDNNNIKSFVIPTQPIIFSENSLNPDRVTVPEYQFTLNGWR